MGGRGAGVWVDFGHRQAHRDSRSTGTVHSRRKRDRFQAHMAPKAPALERVAVRKTPMTAPSRTKTLLMSFDLVGMDADIIRRMRAACAKELGVPDCNVLLTCTHTHGGPHTRRYTAKIGDGGQPDQYAPPKDIDTEYVAFLEKATVDAVRRLVADGTWRECRVGFFSSQCDENRNRRYTTVENLASFNAHRRALHKLTTGIADKELGTVALLDAETYAPLYVIGNYAAHPLASHAPGKGGLRITADLDRKSVV